MDKIAIIFSTITGNAYAYRASDKGKYHTTSEPSAK